MSESKKNRQLFRKRTHSESDDVQIIENSSSQLPVDQFQFFPLSSHWQRQKCQLLNLQYCRANRFGSGGPQCALTRPNLRTVRHIMADGNYLFRALSYVLTGSEDDHMAIRVAILNHITSIAHLLLGVHVMKNSIQVYVQATGMNRNATWGTDVEILTFAI